MEIIITVYVVLLPILLVAGFMPNAIIQKFTWSDASKASDHFGLYTFIKKFNNNLIATANLLLAFFSFYLIYQLYNLYQIATLMGFELFPKNYRPGFYEARIVLIILLPFLFIVKKLSANRVLSLVMFLLLLFDEIKYWFTKKQTMFSVINFISHNTIYYFMFYVSCFVALYAALWLIKRLPSQTKTNVALASS